MLHLVVLSLGSKCLVFGVSVFGLRDLDDRLLGFKSLVFGVSVFGYWAQNKVTR